MNSLTSVFIIGLTLLKHRVLLFITVYVACPLSAAAAFARARFCSSYKSLYITLETTKKTIVVSYTYSIVWNKDVCVHARWTKDSIHLSPTTHAPTAYVTWVILFSVRVFVCFCVDIITLQQFEIYPWNFTGIMSWSKSGMNSNGWILSLSLSWFINIKVIWTIIMWNMWNNCFKCISLSHVYNWSHSTTKIITILIHSAHITEYISTAEIHTFLMFDPILHCDVRVMISHLWRSNLDYVNESRARGWWQFWG